MSIGHNAESPRVIHARQADIVELCRAMGEDMECVSRTKGEYRIKGGQGLIVCGNHYYQHSNDGCGGRLDGQPASAKNNTLSFCMYRYNMDFKSAVDYLNGNVPTVDVNCAVSDRDGFQAVGEDYTPKPTYAPTKDRARVMAYLIQTRGLSEQTVREMFDRGLLKQDERSNCCFIVKDFGSDKVIGYELKGTSTRRRFQQCSFPSGYGFNFRCGEPQGVLYFESAIDLLSYYQLNKTALTHHLLVSMGGLKPTVIDRLYSEYPAYKHCLCVDNDEPANKFTENVRKCHPNILRQTPKIGKDWNDMIRSMKK